MADRISRIQSVGYVSTRVEPVRGYTAKERAAKRKEIDEAMEERVEINKYLAKFPNPEHKSFQQLLDELMNPEKSEMSDDDGVIVDIRSWKK